MTQQIIGLEIRAPAQGRATESIEFSRGLQSLDRSVWYKAETAISPSST